MAKASQEMLVIAKAYDLVLWSSERVAKFPRSHRFTLGDRLERRLYDVLDLLLRGKYVRERALLLRQANLELELLRFQFRLARDLQCISVDSYGFASRTVNDVGSLLGGWIRQTAAVAPK